MVSHWEENLKKLLLQEELINEEQWVCAAEIQKENAERLDRILVRLNYLEEEQICQVLAKTLGLPYFPLQEEKIEAKTLEKISASYAFRHQILPLKEEDGVLWLAVSDPFNVNLIDELKMVTGQDIRIGLALEKNISEALHKYYGIGAATMEKISVQQEKKQAAPEVEKSPERTEEAATIIKFMDQLIADAYKQRATDIHIEPFEDELQVRYRIDGVLHEVPVPATIKNFEKLIVSRIKIMSEMNIAEKRLPQDGRIKYNLNGEEIDIRVSTIPTIWGESVDLRILPRQRILLGLEQLGVDPSDLARMERLIKLPHGIILVTGPTGSGKTTTLYASLSKINSKDKMIITIEDPVEYQLRGINQIQVKPKIGLTFAEGLRSILRQDPNIIMVGEIRDPETAEIAIRASLTGHLVFSTLHTNDACGAITRLIDMGIPPYLVSSSVEAALAQRLVRQLCPECRVKYKPEAEALREVGLDPAKFSNTFIYKPSTEGCAGCGFMGYKGRTGIYEFLLIDDEIRKLILEKGSVGTIKQKAVTLGMKTLAMDGWNKVLAGITSLDEVLRVT
jgi:type II secretion system protein E